VKVVLLVLLAALALGGLVGALVNRDPGYVLVAYQDMALETSLWFAVVLLLLAFLVAWLLGLLLRRFGGGGGVMSAWARACAGTRSACGRRRQLAPSMWTTTA